MPSSNIELLTQVANRLGPPLNEVVFVGGCTTELFITDEAAAEVRPTFDVDVIAEITSRVPASANRYTDFSGFCKAECNSAGPKPAERPVLPLSASGDGAGNRDD